MTETTEKPQEWGMEEWLRALEIEERVARSRGDWRRATEMVNRKYWLRVLGTDSALGGSPRGARWRSSTR